MNCIQGQILNEKLLDYSKRKNDDLLNPSSCNHIRGHHLQTEKCLRLGLEGKENFAAYVKLHSFLCEIILNLKNYTVTNLKSYVKSCDFEDSRRQNW